MKRLNRKGFTLVELLAVIVILAIVVGITLVTVLPTLKKSRREAFELTAQTAADYFEKQYQLYLIGETTTVPFATGESWTTTGIVVTSPTSTTTGKDFTADVYKAAGLKSENYSAGTWYINQKTGRACVTLTAATNDGAKNSAGQAGEYYDAYESDGVTSATTKSSGCPA